MTQQEIEVFLAVVNLGSVSGAAQALYITQPAVSRTLKRLENMANEVRVKGVDRKWEEL